MLHFECFRERRGQLRWTLVVRVAGRRVQHLFWRARTGSWWQQLRCGLRGHSPLLHFDERRMYLRCSCGYESHGWDLTAPAPRVRA